MRNFSQRESTGKRYLRVQTKCEVTYLFPPRLLLCDASIVCMLSCCVPLTVCWHLKGLILGTNRLGQAPISRCWFLHLRPSDPCERFSTETPAANLCREPYRSLVVLTSSLVVSSHPSHDLNPRFAFSVQCGWMADRAV